MSETNSKLASTIQAANAAVKKLPPVLQYTKDTGIVILVIIVTLIILLILVYMVRLFNTTGLKRVDLISKVIPLDQRSNLPYVIPASKMAVTTRGQEFTFSFWLYLSDVYENSTSNKLLFMRGNNTNTFTTIDSTTNPIIMLDKASNTMYFALSTTSSTSTKSITLNNVTDPAAGTNHLVSKVDYVPLQRWVHYVMQVKDNIMTIFIDGDI